MSQNSQTSQNSSDPTDQEKYRFLDRNTQNLKSRFLESFIIFILVLGILAILTAILSQFQTFSLHLYFHEMYTLVSLLTLLVTAPKGFNKLFKIFTTEILNKPIYLYKKDDLQNIKIRLDAAKRRENLEKIHPRNSKFQTFSKESAESRNPKNPPNNSNSVASITQEYKIYKKSKNLKLWKKFIYPVILLVLMLLPVLSVCLTCYNILEILVWKKLLPKIYSSKYPVLGRIFKSLEVFLFSVMESYRVYGKKLTIIQTFGLKVLGVFEFRKQN